MRGVSIVLAVLCAAVICATVTSAAAGRRVAGVQHVTLIGDSVADSIPGDEQALTVVGEGIDLDLEVAACRRVDGDSCPGAGGVRPPNVVQLVKSMGSKLGPNVVIAVGYNDLEDQYAQNIETALTALKAAGVQHVWWLTLRAAHHGYINMNADIEAAMQNHPELSVIDWNVYSRSHLDWFQPDGVHLLGRGPEAMAELIHKTLLADGIAVPPVHIATTTLPAAHRGKAYSARLSARSGLAPYAWSLLARAPKGLHLEASGTIIGRPRGLPGTYVLNVRVKDTAGSFDTRRFALHVKK
jgi:hypothetical protein